MGEKVTSCPERIPPQKTETALIISGKSTGKAGDYHRLCPRKIIRQEGTCK